MRYIMGVCLMFLISGCASKLADNASEKVLDYGMTHSKKVEIIHSKTSRTFVTITYLNPLNHPLVTQNHEQFIVGTYRATGEESFVKTTLRAFEVNGKTEEVRVTPLEKDNPLLTLVSSSNAWTDYVLVEAPYTSTIKMELSFETDHSKRVSVGFRKDY
ncbi:hypothetical protein [Sulfurospirillum barnesii]|uniref:Lipoprotein n=1 Tax=Sulfurospirillum barnesii (strain ATCC 700032 / DSM 10660 / SES-3) TaxID=760154 RepID=I3XVR2_SULBS|nr:hypothetical protein [Sulfurospirillum barnesii]AFL68036.1 hypothetical protein Sulba_0731 [Sulfurospirillum barnesii SES-3]